jgi:eukaryotic-like serine/threonine-protein kinase
LMEADSSTSFATADGIAVGTVDYMSPEQACGREVDGRSDLYSLGCSMYHVMTGALPFPGDSPIERMGKRISGRPVPINDVKRDLPSGLVRVMDRLLASKPQDRYQSATEAAEALQALLRPKNRPAAAKGAKKPSSAVIPPPRLGAPETVIVKITPEYPGWFRPFAGLAERKPALALASVALSVAAAFGLGVLAAWLVRRS